jgi:hypothetical protein
VRHVLSSCVIENEVFWHASNMIIWINWYKQSRWCYTAVHSIYQIRPISAQILIIVKSKTQTNNWSKFEDNCNNNVNLKGEIIVKVSHWKWPHILKPRIFNGVDSRVASVDVVLVVKDAESKDCGELHQSEHKCQTVLAAPI